jgi:mRNA interferase MazF
MPGFEQGDVVRVPFPYSDRSTRQFRPALVVSDGSLGEGGALLWVAMITSAENRAWPYDVTFGDGFSSAGLPAASVVRPCKVATIEARHAETLGQAPIAVVNATLAVLRRLLGQARASPPRS